MSSETSKCEKVIHLTPDDSGCAHGANDKSKCKICGKEICPLNGSYMHPFTHINTHDVDLTVCTKCWRPACQAPEAKKQCCVHEFDAGHVCRYCKLERCHQPPDRKIDHNGMFIYETVHVFLDGRCRLCGGGECKITGRVHHRREDGCCSGCHEGMCDAFDVHDPSDDEISCKRCHKALSEVTARDLCPCGQIHQFSGEVCSLCGEQTCGDSCTSHSACADGHTCSRCKKGLCHDGRSHTFVKDGMSSQLFCTKCGEGKCAGQGMSDDVHRFDENGFCQMCRGGFCPESHGIHECHKIVVEDGELHHDYFECRYCRQHMCPNRPQNQGQGGHSFTRSQDIGIEYCEYCLGQRCDDDRIHIFCGSDGKCVFCPCCRCCKKEIVSGTTVELCHGPDCLDQELWENCRHCKRRLCVRARHERVCAYSVCENDGNGRCKCCRKGLCAAKENPGKSHVFENGVCRYCHNDLCQQSDGNGFMYCHMNVNGFCMYCGTQLCSGNCDHRYEKSSGIEPRICTVCKIEECSHHKGWVHSIWQGHCCELCGFEMCSDGKRVHQIELKSVEVDSQTVNLRCCRLCECQQCRYPEGGNGCHMGDINGKCMKCNEYLCQRNISAADTRIRVVAHQFSEKESCILCKRSKCGSSNVHLCKGKFDKCVCCNKEMCDTGNCPHRFVERRLDELVNLDMESRKKGSLPSVNVKVCEICHQQACPESTAEGVHRFDVTGKCTSCGKYRCLFNCTHDFKDRESDQRKLCVLCLSQRCQEREDICRYSCVGNSPDDDYLCVNCLAVRCTPCLIDKQNPGFGEIRHERRGEWMACIYCYERPTAFHKCVMQAVNGSAENKCKFAEMMQEKFEGLHRPDETQSPPTRDAMEIARLAVKYLPEGNTDTLLDWADKGNPAAQFLYAREPSSDGDTGDYLMRASSSGYEEAEVQYLETLIDPATMDAACSLLSRILSHMRRDLPTSLMDKVKSSGDTRLNRLLVEYYVSIGDRDKAKGFMSAEKLSDDDRCDLAIREYQNGQYDFLLEYGKRKTNNQSSAMLGAMCVARALFLAMEWKESVADKIDESTWEKALRTKCAPLEYQYWKVRQTDDAPNKANESIKESVRHEYLRAFYDLRRLADPIESTEPKTTEGEPQILEQTLLPKVVLNAKKALASVVLELSRGSFSHPEVAGKRLTTIFTLLEQQSVMTNDEDDEFVLIRQDLSSEIARLEHLSQHMKTQIEWYKNEPRSEPTDFGGDMEFQEQIVSRMRDRESYALGLSVLERHSLQGKICAAKYFVEQAEKMLHNASNRDQIIDRLNRIYRLYAGEDGPARDLCMKIYRVVSQAVRPSA